MVGTFTTNNPNTTVAFSFTASTQKVLDTASDAAAYLASKQGLDISGYTNQQKLNLIDSHIKQVLLDLAKTHHITNASETARTVAITETETKYL